MGVMEGTAIYSLVAVGKCKSDGDTSGSETRVCVEMGNPSQPRFPPRIAQARQPNVAEPSSPHLFNTPAEAIFFVADRRSPFPSPRSRNIWQNKTLAQQVLPFYPGEEGSLSFNSDILLDGSTPHIREIYFAGKYNATYQGGDVVQVIRPVRGFSHSLLCPIFV